VRWCDRRCHAPKKDLDGSLFGARAASTRRGVWRFNLFLRRAYDDKDEQEDLIQDSGLDWVIARPVILTNGSRTCRYRVLVEPRSWRIGFISRADVADFLVKQIDDNAYLGKTPVLTGWDQGAGDASCAPEWPAGVRFRRSGERQSGRLGAVTVNLFVDSSRPFGRERDDLSRLDLGPAGPEQIAQ
jgi:NAD(P)H-binding